MLKQINEFDSRETPLTLFHSAIPNASITILDYIITNFLDNERPVVNLGAYTGRDLDYLLPICKKNNKQIECVESFEPLTNEDKKQQLIHEIESAYSSSLLKWTWKDASESEYLRSADYIYFSTDYRFPIEKYILSTNHPCVWACSNPTWIWPRLGQAFYNEQIYTLLSHSITLFTNSLEIKDKVYEYFIKNSDRVQEMVDEGYLAGQPGIGRVALQSIKQETLDAIHRPEIPWSDHKRLIQEYKESRHHQITISAELINDLPLMSDLDYVWQAIELYEAGIETISFNNWEYLPNAPVNENDYLNRWGLQKIKTLNVGMNDELIVSGDKDSILQSLKPNNHYYSNGVVGEAGVPNTIGFVVNKLFNYCFDHKRDFKQELSKHIDTLLTLSEMWKKQMISRKLANGTVVFGFYSKAENKYINHYAWLEKIYGRLIFSKTQAKQIVHPQYEEIHKLLQTHIVYHKLPKAVLQNKVA